MRKNTKLNVTNRTIARDMMNMLRPDSILNRNIKNRQKTATERAKKWREQNSEKAKEIGVSGGIECMKLRVGIHAETFEIRSERAKKNYKQGKGFAKLTKDEKSIIGKTFGKKNLVGEIVCEKCGRITNKGNYKQFHGNKCRELDKIKLIKELPDFFTKSIVKETANRIGIESWEKLNILHSSCPYTTIHIKVDKPNQFNPCWYKKI